jgi:hypothetical protein
MTAVPIFVWNGSAWQATGPTIPASPIAYQASAPSSPSTGDIWVDSDGDVTTGSQQFQRFRFVASGGETTISGADADGAILAYTAGLEQVILNGAVLVRGQDYTATDGTNITGLSPALVASDVLEVFSFIAFTVANTYTQSQVDGFVATATAEPGMKLIVPSSATNGTVGASGAVTFTTQSSVSVNGCFTSTYKNYYINISGTSGFNANLDFRLRASGTDLTSSSYHWSLFGNSSDDGTVGTANSDGGTSFRIDEIATRTFGQQIWLFNPFATEYKLMNTRNFRQRSTGDTKHSTSGGGINVNTSYDGFTIFASQTFSGTIRVYGYKN